MSTDSISDARKTKFEEVKATAPKEPSGVLDKKEYIIGCYTKDDWVYVHDILTKDGTLEDNIPNQNVKCSDDCLHSEVRGRYLLDDTEATELKKHARVEYVNLNTAAYPGTYQDNPDEFTYAAVKERRYNNTVKHQRDADSAGVLPSFPAADLKNRCTSQLMRHSQFDDPWNPQSSGNEDTDVFEVNPKQYGTGKDVDCIVCDQDMWFGHIEFQNHLGVTTSITSADVPQNYIGGNVLSNKGISNTVGCCDLLDLILDAPYYLDPDFFNGDSARLTTRWDKTVVPDEGWARDWWSTNNLSNRSAKFVSTGNGGTATGVYDFGTITGISNNYTRANSNGSNTAYQTGSGYHGTPCASQVYGRNYGWAYNANKWFLNLYGTWSPLWEIGFDLQKVFHQCKPINPKYGTQDPTISSNSWGLRDTPSSSGYYYFRQGVSGGIGVTFSSKTGTFMGSYWNWAQRVMEYTPGHSILGAGYELIESGVIFVAAGGNHDQKVVIGSHPDYNNYHASAMGADLADAEAQDASPYSSFNHNTYNTHNRPGFPPQIGIYTGGSGIEYKTIAVGALDDEYNSSTNQEQKVGYSNMGNAIDCWATADASLSASDDRSGTRYDRNDSVYMIDGSPSITSEDRLFSGTSSATPIAVGIMATKLEYNRDWTALDLKNWFAQCGSASTTHFYYGTESTTATDATWTDTNNMQGSLGYVLWDKLTGNEKDNKKFGTSGGLTANGVQFIRT